MAVVFCVATLRFAINREILSLWSELCCEAANGRNVN